MSRPESSTGSPCIWIGVGRVMPLPLRWVMIALWYFIPAKLVIGGATSSPSTSMCHFDRSWSESSSSRARAYLGAPKQTENGVRACVRVEGRNAVGSAIGHRLQTKARCSKIGRRLHHGWHWSVLRTGLGTGTEERALLAQSAAGCTLANLTTCQYPCT